MNEQYYRDLAERAKAETESSESSRRDIMNLAEVLYEYFTKLADQAQLDAALGGMTEDGD